MGSRHLRMKLVFFLSRMDSSCLFLALVRLVLLGGVCLNCSSPRCPMAHSLTPSGLYSNVNLLPRPSWNTLLKLNPSPNPLLLLTLFLLCINISLQHWPSQTLSLSLLKMVLRVPRSINVPGRRAWVGLSHWGMEEDIENTCLLGSQIPAPPFLAGRGRVSTQIRRYSGGSGVGVPREAHIYPCLPEHPSHTRQGPT